MTQALLLLLPFILGFSTSLIIISDGSRRQKAAIRNKRASRVAAFGSAEREINSDPSIQAKFRELCHDELRASHALDTGSIPSVRSRF